MSQRAYLIYECQHGWCYEPVEMETRFSLASDNCFADAKHSGRLYTYLKLNEPRKSVRAFSRLTQLFWYLGNLVRADDRPNTEHLEAAE